MKIAIIGTGYVGLPSGVGFAELGHTVVCVDNNKEKIDALNKGKLTLYENGLEDLFKANTKKGRLHFTTSMKEAVQEADLVILAVGTPPDPVTHEADLQYIYAAATELAPYLTGYTVIANKSTVPVGTGDAVEKIISAKNPKADFDVVSLPEFLREGKALHDCLYPSRIIVGHPLIVQNHVNASKIVELLIEGIQSTQPVTLIMGASEAEAVKLFANTYLALRVSFFNEMDTYAELKGLNSREIIEGVGLDPRIGLYYNNPSFGYGGYCLPKDSKQLLSNYDDVPQKLISAIVAANETRKSFIVSQVLKRNPKIVGLYRLTMKSDSDNFRESSIQDVMRMLACHNLKIIIYEPILDSQCYQGYEVISDLKRFVESSDVILANRIDKEIGAYSEKVYTRDLYMKN